jgi:hypothetical protein
MRAKNVDLYKRVKRDRLLRMLFWVWLPYGKLRRSLLYNRLYFPFIKLVCSKRLLMYATLEVFLYPLLLHWFIICASPWRSRASSLSPSQRLPRFVIRPEWYKYRGTSSFFLHLLCLTDKVEESEKDGHESMRKITCNTQHIHTCVRACVRAYVHTYMRACVRAYIHTF